MKLQYTLLDGDFRVHKAGCADLTRRTRSVRTGRGDYVAPLEAASEEEAIRDLWSDIIGDYGLRPEEPSREWLEEHGLVGATDFLPCTAGLVRFGDDLVATPTARRSRRVGSDRDLGEPKEDEMPRQTKNQAATPCEGTGEKWAVLDGTPACPACERSPGAIGADAPAKRGRGFAGTVPEHFVSAPTETTKANPSAERFTLEHPDEDGAWFILDNEKGDLAGSKTGYKTEASAQAAADKINRLVSSRPQRGSVPTPSEVTPPPARPTARQKGKAAQAREDAEEAATRVRPSRSRSTTAATEAAPRQPRAAQTRAARQAAPTPTVAETASNGAAKKQEAKRVLARAALHAIEQMFDNLPDDSVVFEVFSEDEAALILSNWAHHWPVGETWPSDILPVPDRSNWK